MAVQFWVRFVSEPAQEIKTAIRSRDLQFPCLYREAVHYGDVRSETPDWHLQHFSQLFRRSQLVSPFFSAFPAFDQLQNTVQAYIFVDFAPQVADTFLNYIEGFTQQTGKLTALGIVFLAVTSIMLLLSISNAFDAIWHSQGERALISKLLVYWSVLTLAPLLLGASALLSSYFFTIAQAIGVEQFTSPLAG